MVVLRRRRTIIRDPNNQDDNAGVFHVAAHQMTAERAAKPLPNIGVGAPGWYALNSWGRELEAAFGATAYLVGSAALGKQWRDVDVRVILRDEDFTQLFGDTEQMNFNPRWAAYSAAFSAWGKQVTGLPIDFQVQPMTHANEHYHGVRCPLGIMPHRPWEPAS